MQVEFASDGDQLVLLFFQVRRAYDFAFKREPNWLSVISKVFLTPPGELAPESEKFMAVSNAKASLARQKRILLRI